MPAPPPADAVARRTRRKVALRALPLLFVLYVVAYLDRANVGFAKLRMQSELGFSDAVFGWGMGLFFVGYLFLEIPGALLVERWSARKWFARILVTWGACSMAMAAVRTPAGFYALRFLLGLAEAGFFPGVIVLIVLFTSIFTTMSVIEDRHEGFLQAVLVAPASRTAVVLGKVLGGVSIAMLQALLVLALAPLAGFPLGGVSWPFMLAVLVLTAIGLSALGFALAWAMST